MPLSHNSSKTASSTKIFQSSEKTVNASLPSVTAISRKQIISTKKTSPKVWVPVEFIFTVPHSAITIAIEEEIDGEEKAPSVKKKKRKKLQKIEKTHKNKYYYRIIMIFLSVICKFASLVYIFFFFGFISFSFFFIPFFILRSLKFFCTPSGMCVSRNGYPSFFRISFFFFLRIAKFWRKKIAFYVIFFRRGIVFSIRVYVFFFWKDSLYQKFS